MKKLFKAIAVLCAVANLGTISASALYVTDYNGELRVSSYRYEIDSTENWITAENTPATQDTSKFRLMYRDQRVENPAPAYVDAEYKELVLPIVSRWPDYMLPLDVQELKQLSKLTIKDSSGQTNNEFMNCYFGFKAWYEPAPSTTYTADSTTTDANIQPCFYGNYKCNVCGKYAETHGAELFDNNWSAEVMGEHFTHYGEKMGVGRANATAFERFPGLNVIFELPCDGVNDGEPCEGTAELCEAFMRFQPDAAAFEKMEFTDEHFITTEDGTVTGNLKEEYIGKIHVSDFHFGLNAAPSRGGHEGERDILIDDAEVYTNWEDNTYEFKAKFINFTNQNYQPRMIIAAYKDGVLKRVQIGGWGVPSAWDSSAIQTYYGDWKDKPVKNFEGSTVHSGRIENADINGDYVIDEKDYDFDEVKGFIWTDINTMVPVYPSTENN